jgi:GDPmannose 4,6-dehydratase
MAQKTALITGITGQIGSYLAELLLSLDYRRVHGLVRPSSDVVASRERIESFANNPRVELHYGDLSDQAGLTRLLRQIKPDEIYNLAAQSHVAISFSLPCATGDVTGLGCLRLLEAMREASPESRFYQASSSELFGNSPAPQSEKTPFRPRSPYAAAKLFAYTVCVNYREAYGLHVSNGILFNSESPRRGPGFVTRKITRGVARIANTVGRPADRIIRLGNLNARRDWMHAKDAVRGMHAMLQQDGPGDYVLASGRSESVKTFCEMAFQRVKIPLFWVTEKIPGLIDREYAAYFTEFVEMGRVRVIEVDPAYIRPTEVPHLCGDAGKAWRVLGWRPEISLESLIDEMVEADLNRES